MISIPLPLNIYGIEQKIRVLIREPPVFKTLAGEPSKFNRVCSALDVIGDTCVAIKEYNDIASNCSLQFHYLTTYGVLQVLQVQQNAVQDLADTLNVRLNSNKKLDRIRRIRARTVGHPTRGKVDKVDISGFISRMSLTLRGFDLLTMHSDGKYIIERVNLAELIHQQSEEVAKQLIYVEETLKAEQEQHRAMYRDTKLTEILHPTIPYMLSKAYEALNHEDHIPVARAGLQTTKNCLVKLRKKIEERDIYQKQTLDNWFNDAFYAIDKLLCDLTDSGWDRLNKYDVQIYTTYLEHKYDELRRIAAEIDEEYERYPE